MTTEPSRAELLAEIAQLRAQLADQRHADALQNSDARDKAELSRTVLLSVLEDQQRSNRAVRELERRMSDILGNIDEVVWSTDAESGRMLFVNAAVEPMFGRQVKEFMEDPGLRLATTLPEDRPLVTGFDRAVREQGKADAQFRIQRPDGSVRWVRASGALVRSADGKPARIDGVLSDITESKRAEEQIRRYLEQVQSAFMRTVEVAMNLSEMRDPYTAGHERRVAELAVAIGAEMGLDDHRLEGLRVAGYLHDIGKISIPAELLSKPGKLTQIEYSLIKGHPQAGYEVMKNVEFPWPVAQVALQHHERIDGSGYPQGLKGDNILPEARIVAVADVIEAMTSHRPYRPGLGVDAALKEIERGRGTAYDPVVADACVRLFRDKHYAIPD